MVFAPLTVAALAVYALVVLATAFAAARSHTARQLKLHRIIWIALVLLFILAACSRLFGLEEILRDGLRAYFAEVGAYGQRREFQRPLVSGLVLLSAALMFIAVYRASKKMRGRRDYAVLIASAAGSGMVVLWLMRLISLHDIDALLYGPFKLNWFADIGFSGLVFGSAVFYCRVVSNPR